MDPHKMVTRVQCFEEDSIVVLQQKINYFFHFLETYERPVEMGVNPVWELVDIKFTTPEHESFPACAMGIYKANFDICEQERAILEANSKIGGTDK